MEGCRGSFHTAEVWLKSTFQTIINNVHTSLFSVASPSLQKHTDDMVVFDTVNVSGRGSWGPPPENYLL